MTMPEGLRLANEGLRLANEGLRLAGFVKCCVVTLEGWKWGRDFIGGCYRGVFYRVIFTG